MSSSSRFASRLTRLARPLPESERLVDRRFEPPAPALVEIEYVSSEKFEGFTRRGIRIGDRAQMDLLRDVLQSVLEAGGFAKPAPGLMPVQ